MALAAIGNRDTSKGLAPLSSNSRPVASSSSAVRPPSRPKPLPLFMDDEGEDDDTDITADPELLTVLQQSLEDEEEKQLQQALEESRTKEEDRRWQFRGGRTANLPGSTYVTLMSRVNGPAANLAAVRNSIMEPRGEAPRASSSLSGLPPASPHHSPSSPRIVRKPSTSNEKSETPPQRPRLPSTPSKSSPLGENTADPQPSTSRTNASVPQSPRASTSYNDLGGQHVLHGLENKVIVPQTPPPISSRDSVSKIPLPEFSPKLKDDIQFPTIIQEDDDLYVAVTSRPSMPPPRTSFSIPSNHNSANPPRIPFVAPNTRTVADLMESDDSMEEIQAVPAPIPIASHLRPNSLLQSAPDASLPLDIDEDIEVVAAPTDISRNEPPTSLPAPPPSSAPIASSSKHLFDDGEPMEIDPDEDFEDAVQQEDHEPQPEDWDAAQEMDPEGEEGEFASFMSQIKGRDINTVRDEIDEELKTLHKQKKAAMRDSEDITQQMISQIQVNSFLSSDVHHRSHTEICSSCSVYSEYHISLRPWRLKRNVHR